MVGDGTVQSNDADITADDGSSVAFGDGSTATAETQDVDIDGNYGHRPGRRRRHPDRRHRQLDQRQPQHRCVDQRQLQRRSVDERQRQHRGQLRQRRQLQQPTTRSTTAATSTTASTPRPRSRTTTASTSSRPGTDRVPAAVLAAAGTGVPGLWPSALTWLVTQGSTSHGGRPERRRTVVGSPERPQRRRPGAAGDHRLRAPRPRRPAAPPRASGWPTRRSTCSSSASSSRASRRWSTPCSTPRSARSTTTSPRPCRPPSATATRPRPRCSFDPGGDPSDPDREPIREEIPIDQVAGYVTEASDPDGPAAGELGRGVAAPQAAHRRPRHRRHPRRGRAGLGPQRGHDRRPADGRRRRVRVRRQPGVHRAPSSSSCRPPGACARTSSAS